MSSVIEGWIEVMLSDLGDIVTGKTPSTEVTTNFGGDIPFITPSDMDGRKTISETQRYLSEAGAESVRSAIIPSGTVIISCIGSDMGKTALCGRRSVTNQQINSVMIGDQPTAEFVYYNLLARKAEFQYMAAGSAQPILNKRDFSKIRMMLPDRESRARIAHILGTLDDKIELNRRMNRTLEAIARAIFKGWFIDFDPVIDNAILNGKPIPDEFAKRAEVRREILARSQPSPPSPLPEVEGRQSAPDAGPSKVSSSPFGRGEGEGVADYRHLFPDSFQDSPLGKIPKGWEVGNLDSLLALSRNSIKPLEFPKEQFDHFSIAAFDAGEPSRDFGETIRSSKYMVPSSAVLISKLNPHLPRVWFPQVSDVRRAICSTEFLVCVPKSGVPREYVYGLLSSRKFLDRFAQLVTGTTGSHQRVHPATFLKMNTVLPTHALCDVFARSVRPIQEERVALLSESSDLAAMREILLPELLSGKLELTNEGTVL